MNFAVITKDFTENGCEGTFIPLCLNKHVELWRKRFRLYADDQLIFQGYFYDDEKHKNQQTLLEWGKGEVDYKIDRIEIAIGKSKFRREV